MGVGRERAELSVGTQLSARALRPLHTSPPRSGRPRRHHRGAGLAFCQRGPDWHRVSVTDPEAQPSAHTLGARGHASPTPRRRVAEVWSRTAGKREGEGSVRTTKPAPSEYPHVTALGKFAAPRQNPHVLPQGFCFDPPEGWVDWVWLIGYKRGGARKR
jgi:hypothetical protein